MNELDIFSAALELQSPEQRGCYLDEACGNDRELRRRIDELLGAHAHAGSFMDDPASPRVPQATIDEPIREAPGTIIGPYKLLEQIGEGGFGVVFMAEQTQPVRRKVALKVLKPGMDTRQVVARFEAERQALALMDHENIARVFDGGETASGRPYFVMELVRGVPITAFCDQKQLAVRARLELFASVCQAVQHAHQKGIIHRDIKPSNVLVTLHDDRPVVKVIDFGIAKATGQQLTEKTLFTNFAQMIGTPMYMSPEQAQMSGLDIDTRSDIYSLGVLLYELLTGTTPLTTQRLKEAALAEVLRVIREEEPPRPSTRLSESKDALVSISAQRATEPAKLTRLVRGELDWIVMKALDKDRNRRYGTANGFAMDVERYLADEPVEACPPSFGYRVRKFTRRNKRVLGVVALVALMLIVAAAAVLENFRREAKTQEDAREELAKRLATTESAVSLALARSDSLAGQAAHLPTATSNEAAAAVAVWRQADAELAQAEAALVTGTAEPAVQERVASARRRLDLGRGQAEQQYARVLREEKLRHDLDEAILARGASKGDQIDAATAAELFAKAFKDYGLEVKPGQSAALAQQIRAEKPELRDALIVALDDWAFVAVHAKASTLAAELRAIAKAADDDPWRITHRDAVAKRDVTTLKDLARKARDLSLPASSLCLLAESLDDRGQRAEAVALLRWARTRHLKDVWIPYQLGIVLGLGPRGTAAQIEEHVGCFRVFLAMRPNSAIALNNLGVGLGDQGKDDEALACFRAAVRHQPDLATAQSNLGGILVNKGELKEALAALDEAIRLRPDKADFHSNRGVALLHSGLVDEAILAHETAIKLNPKLAAAYSNLGYALSKKSRFEQALAACEEAIRLNPKLAEPHTIRGIILTKQRRFEEAIVASENAIRLDPGQAEPYWNLANLLSENKRPAEAEKNARKALELRPNLAYAHGALGLALALQEKDTDAIASFREALRHKPDFAGAHFNLGMVYIKQKHAAEALAAMELAIKHDPRYAEAHYQIGRILAERKQHAEALKFFKQAHLLKEGWAEARLQVGVSQRELGEWDAAMESFKEVLRLDPRHALVHYNLGLVHERQKRPDDAIASFKESIRLHPDHVASHYNLGTLLADKKQLDAAADAYRQAIKLDRNYAKAHHNLGSVLAMKGKVADAIPCFREALRCKPDYPTARAMLAQALNVEAWRLVVPMEASRADVERAVKMAGEATLLNPKSPDYWNTLGVGNYRAGNWDEAIAALKKSASISKENDWCDFLFLAMAHWKKGDKAEAGVWYDRAVMRIRDQRINTDLSRRFQAEAAALLGVAKKP